MRFTTLNIDNFLSLEKAEIQLADRGLVLIQGVNEDNTSALSNGSGKSSVADALCWCLYGVTARGVSGDAVVNRSAGKNTYVGVSIVDGPDEYRIARYRKHKTYKNALAVIKVDPVTSVATDLSKGTDKLTQELVDQIVGSSYEVFRAAVYAGQEAMPDLPAMTDKQLKLLVEEAAGVTVLEAAYQEARMARDLIKGRLESQANLLRIVDTAIASDEANEIAYRDGQKKFEERRSNELATMAAHLRVAQDGIAALKVLIAKKDKAAIQAQIAALELKIAAVADERTREKDLEKIVRDEEVALLHASSKVKTWRADYDAAKAKFDACGSIVGKPCDECGKPYCEDDIADTRARLKARLKEIADKAPDMKRLVEDAKGRTEKARETLEAFRATMTDVSETSAQIASLRDELADIQTMENDLGGFVRDESATAAQIKRRNAEINPFDEMLVENKRSLDTRKTEKKTALEDMAALEDELAIHETVVKVFSPSGVRAHILDEVTPFLNDQTAKYLASLTDGNTTATWSTLVKTAKGELREKFSIEVADTSGSESFAALSGGEKRKVRIAAALALQDLVARRATKPIELFIGDEIDDALDQAGLERLTSILEEKARERGSVFIISHNSLTDWISQVVMVTKKDGKSVITEGVT